MSNESLKVVQNDIKKTAKDAGKATGEIVTNIKNTTKKAAGKASAKTKQVKKNLKPAAEKVSKVINTVSQEVSNTVEKIVPAKPKTQLYVQFMGNEISEDAILNIFNAEWKKEHKLSDIKELNIYYKVEENTAYCVVNNDTTVSIKIA